MRYWIAQIVEELKIHNTAIGVIDGSVSAYGGRPSGRKSTVRIARNAQRLADAEGCARQKLNWRFNSKLCLIDNLSHDITGVGIKVSGLPNHDRRTIAQLRCCDIANLMKSLSVGGLQIKIDHTTVLIHNKPFQGCLAVWYWEGCDN